MKNKLTESMRRTLAAMNDEWYSAYDLGESLSTLEALKNRGFVRSRVELGYIAFPRNNILWKITEKGRRALEGCELK